MGLGEDETGGGRRRWAMLGAIAGDVIGSVHEGACTKTKNFPLLTPERP
jgi:hypothetical protein